MWRNGRQNIIIGIFRLKLQELLMLLLPVTVLLLQCWGTLQLLVSSAHSTVSFKASYQYMDYMLQIIYIKWRGWQVAYVMWLKKVFFQDILSIWNVFLVSLPDDVLGSSGNTSVAIYGQPTPHFYLFPTCWCINKKCI